MKTLADRIKMSRQRSGLTQRELAARVGMAQGDISKLENDQIAETTKIAQLAKALRCDAYWLATGEGARDGISIVPDDIADIVQSQIYGLDMTSAFGNVPVMAEINVSDGKIRLDRGELMGHLRGIEVKKGFAIRNGGDAFHPAVREGWYFVIDEAAIPNGGDIVIATMKDGSVLVRELMYESAEGWLSYSLDGSQRSTLLEPEVETLHVAALLASPRNWRRAEER